SRPGIVKTLLVCSDAVMSEPSPRRRSTKSYRFPPEIISLCVWLYCGVGVSLRDVSELMLARGIEVSSEALPFATGRHRPLALRCATCPSWPGGSTPPQTGWIYDLIRWTISSWHCQVQSWDSDSPTTSGVQDQY